MRWRERQSAPPGRASTVGARSFWPRPPILSNVGVRPTRRARHAGVDHGAFLDGETNRGPCEGGEAGAGTQKSARRAASPIVARRPVEKSLFSTSAETARHSRAMPPCPHAPIHATRSSGPLLTRSETCVLGGGLARARRTSLRQPAETERSKQTPLCRLANRGAAREVFPPDGRGAGSGRLRRVRSTLPVPSQGLPSPCLHPPRLQAGAASGAWRVHLSLSPAASAHAVWLRARPSTPPWACALTPPLKAVGSDQGRAWCVGGLASGRAPLCGRRCA